MIQNIRRHPVITMLLLLITTYAYEKIASDYVITTIPVGVTPAALGITPDNKFAYVANNNNYGLVNGDNVTVIDLTNNTVVTTIYDPSFNQPYTVTINKEGTKAYITNSNGTTITIIDIPSNIVAGTIDGFDGPSGMVITPDGKRAYVNNYGGPSGVGSGNATTVRIVDLTTNSIIGAPITTDLAPAALAITPDGSSVYVANYVDGNTGTGTVQIIPTNTDTPATPLKRITGFSGPFDITISHDGQFAYVTNFGSNNFMPIGTTVSVIELKLNSIIDTINVGMQPSGIALSPDDRYAYVTNYDTLYTDTSFSALVPGDGTVNIIDTKTNKVIPPILPVGQSPAAISITSNGKFAYVSNYSSNSVSVLNILERMWLK